jgi:two-component system chemotaxis sensor kinase CheA
MKVVDSQIEQLKCIFFQECSELLATLEHELSELKRDRSDPHPLHAAFRAIHTIKGGAGMLGLSRIVDLTHAIESTLRDMRSGSTEINDKVVDAVIHATDAVTDLIQAARVGAELEREFECDALARLAAVTGGRQEIGSPAAASRGDGIGLPGPSGSGAPSDEPPVTIESSEADRNLYRIVFRPMLGLLKRSNEPLLIFQHLRKLGTLTVEADISNLPDFADLVPTDAYLGWKLTLDSGAAPATVREAFEFVEGDCELLIEHSQRRNAESEGRGAGEAAPKPKPPMTDPTAISSPASRGSGASSIRVDTDRIDRLANLVGELAITQAIIYQNIDQSTATSNPKLFNEVSLLLRLTRSLHDSVMAIRAQPIRSVFARLPRIVRDLVDQTGKPVRLELSGEETEVDRSLIEQLVDPLMHLIRNAVDHGIESSDLRALRGKPAVGTILIEAAQRGSQVAIEISDDGGGIDIEKVRRKATEIGLISADANLTDDEISNLIFAPGLSTTDEVTSLSGRGVGLDVVKSNLQKLGGRISISSEQGKGSRLTMTLPLTLAVTDGMIVRVGTEQYVIPIARVLECVPLTQNQVKSVPGIGEIMHSRGTNVRVVQLASTLNAIPGVSRHYSKQLAVLVEIDANERIALVVDEIVGQQQVVIKSLRENFEPPRGIAGATILGNGGIALFLDVSAIADMSSVACARNFPSTHVWGEPELQVA